MDGDDFVSGGGIIFSDGGASVTDEDTEEEPVSEITVANADVKMLFNQFAIVGDVVAVDTVVLYDIVNRENYK